MHVPWYIPGSLTSGFLWRRRQGHVPGNSRRMYKPQCYVSCKRPMVWPGISIQHTVSNHSPKVLSSKATQWLLFPIWYTSLVWLTKHQWNNPKDSGKIDHNQTITKDNKARTVPASWWRNVLRQAALPVSHLNSPPETNKQKTQTCCYYSFARLNLIVTIISYITLS